MPPQLQLRAIEKSFGATRALAGVNLEIGAGEVHALIGENGAGKSTLMNVLSGSVQPDSGALCPHLSVAENILLGVEPSRSGWLDKPAILSRARELLSSFGRSDIDPTARVSNLSLASRQVVEICRALAWNPRLILMDEPTSSLQRENVERLFSAIRALKTAGVSIIYISHFLEEVREIADRFTVLRDGASVRTGTLGEISDEKIIFDMVGRTVEAIFEHRRPVPSGEALLEVRDLCWQPKLKSAGFTLRRGEVLGIAGLIGSGRTEMVKAIYGLTGPVSGEIRVRGQAVSGIHAGPQKRIAQGFGYLSEDRKNEGLALPLSIADNVTLSRFEKCSSRGWISLSRQRDLAAQQLATLNVKAQSSTSAVASLSGGNQQKVGMARLLHQDPDILLLDEPTRGIDVASKADLYAEISRLAASGKAILMVSSYLPELFGVCDRIAVMNRGVLTSARNASEWTPESVMQSAISIPDQQGSAA
ncbi:MAG: sugar ABC transporter ATP-binding protein [Acidobacteria bacterium]|nr:sugar ABC transporter ATP-binding protein [Acidobacteriota bacterium]